MSAPPRVVRDVLVDLEHFPVWWPQVRAVAKLGPDDAMVCCRSTLPYTLELLLHAVSRELPTIEVTVAGDLEGFVRWTLTAVPGAQEACRMVFEQEVIARGPVAVASRLIRPVLEWNHARMMAGCRRGLASRLGAEVVGPAEDGAVSADAASSPGGQAESSVPERRSS